MQLKTRPPALLVLLLLMLPFSLAAQYTVSARIKDKSTSEALPYCSVALMQNDSAHSFAITDNSGYFEIPATRGQYKLVIRYVGYMPDTIAVKVSNKNVYLGIIRMQPDARELSGVEIKASTKNIDIDKDEVMVTNKMRTAASSAREVLEKVNGVTYDRYNDAIKVDNDGNIIILVNGLEKNQEYIKNLDPERIAKIEVIRDPAGRYGVEGYSAIINIILKQNYVGQELQAGLTNIFDYKAPSSDYILPIQNYNLGYNYSRKNLNLYARGYASFNHFGMPHSINTVYANGLEIEQTQAAGQDRNMSMRQQNYNITLGADYQLDSKNTISLELNGNQSPENPTTTDYQYNFLHQDSLVQSVLYQSQMESQSSGWVGSLFYIGNYDDSRSLKADFTYGQNSSESTTEFGFLDSARVRNGTDTRISFANLNAEWTQTLSKKFSWQAGYGGKWKDSKNNNLIQDSATYHRYTEYRNKAFAYGTWRIAEKLQMKFGIGLENNYAQFDQYERSLWIFKPHFDLFYKPGQMFNMKLKYRVSTSYPDISQTDPTEIQTDMFSISKGNPKLKPTAIHHLSLKMNVLQGLISIEPYFEYSNNYITSVGYLQPDGVFISTYGNSGEYINKGVEANLTIPLGKSFVWQNSLDLYQSDLSYQDISNSLSDWRGESQLIYMNQKLDLMAGLLYQRYNSNYITLQGHYNGQNDYWAVMLQKGFFKNSLNVMLLAFLPIDWGADFTQTNYVQTKDYEQTAITDINILKQLFMVQVNYRFHKGKTITHIEKEVEQERVKQKGGIF